MSVQDVPDILKLDNLQILYKALDLFIAIKFVRWFVFSEQAQKM